jgi:hypothetical protein
VSALLAISEDPDGNTPEELLNEDEAKACYEFLSYMASHGNPGTIDLVLEVSKTRRALTETEMLAGSQTYGRKSRPSNSLKWRTIGMNQGWQLGCCLTADQTMFPEPGSVVYLCVDGSLRCERRKPVFEDGSSVASGVGTIPNPMADFNLTIVPGYFTSWNRDLGTKLVRQTVEDRLKDLVTSLTVSTEPQ